MKSINITLQFSNFKDTKSKHATALMIQILIDNGFVPCCVHDLYYKKKRTRVLLLVKWQNIKIQDYFQLLPENKYLFDIFWHDCNIQNLNWEPKPKIEIMTKSKIQGHILVERFKSIF